MVGDWVLLFGDTLTRVDCIGNVEVYLNAADTGDWRTTYEHIQPIPLTPEILQANGIQLVEVGDNGISTPAKFRNRFEKWAIRTEWRDAPSSRWSTSSNTRCASPAFKRTSPYERREVQEPMPALLVLRPGQVRERPGRLLQDYQIQITTHQ